MLHLTLQNFSTRDVMQNIFCPIVGAVSSPGADDICQKNNLSFVELLQPFSKITNDPVFRDAQGSSVSLKGVRLNISDVEWRPPQTVLARKMLNDAVSSINCENTKTMHLEGGKDRLEIPLSEPWYEQWRETFLAVQFPADHEFTRHFLACLIVVSSSETSPIESAQQLTNKVHMMQTMTPPKLPKWFSTEPLNCYVMLHDSCTGDVSKAQQSFEQLKALYGEDRCFLLQINSHQGAPGECPDPWLRFLKKQLKHEQPMEEYSVSSPRTPQDITVTGLPMTMQLSALESNNGSSSCSTPPNMEIIIQHPLSPLQEQNSIVQLAQMATEESGQQQLNAPLPTINPNVWASSEANDIPEIVPHGMMLTPNDLENLKHFVQDFTIRALLPYIERLAFQLNDSIANKKGVSRSLLTATKRWFGTNKPGVAPATQNAVVYTNESTELQTRKLGDLYFMFGHYSAAFTSYHQAKRDFNADSAWQYYAGALEMAALSAFMLGTASRKTFDYMEEAILTYLNSCKMPQFATRATLLSAECLKSSRLYGEAAKQLIRMTSEDSDLRSALFLEQASYAFLHSTPPLYRKYAFHSVLAGHRFSKSGQRKHAFRCYKQAYQVFKDRGWSLAEDHIQYTIGKQALSLKRLTEASGALSHLLRPSSLQTPSQQGAFLREYIATHKSMQQNQIGGEQQEAHLLQISLPRIVSNQTKVLVMSQPPVAKLQMIPAANLTLDSSQHDEWIWHKMEEMCLQSASKRPVMIFKPIKNLFTNHSVNPDGPLAVHGEPIEISVTLENTIKIPITFSDISLLWSFQGTDNSNNNQQSIVVSNEELLFNLQSSGEHQLNPALRASVDEIAYATKVSQVTITEHECRTVKFKLTPKRVGTIAITGLVGQLAAQNEQESLWGKLEFEALAIRPTGGPVQVEKPKTFDKRLEIQVLDAAPALAISFSEIPSEVLAGELIPITMQFSNCGVSEISDLYMAFEHPRNFLVETAGSSELPLSLLRGFKDLTNVNLSRDKETRKQYVSRIFDTTLDEGQKPLAPNETRSVRLWLQVPYKKGAIEMRALAYYSLPGQYNPKMKYRLIRHSWNLMVIESVAIETNCNLTNPVTEEIGVDFAVRNLNQVHHPVSTEVAVNELAIFCPKYRFRGSDEMVRFTSPGSERIFKHGQLLLATELLNLRLALEVREEDVSKADEVQFISSQISKLSIQAKSKPTSGTEVEPVPMETTSNSFLMKEETKYLRVFGQTSNNEEFNQIVAMPDQHMTLILNWSAAVKDNNATTVQRIARGQHFVQMRHLYESSFCPRGSEHSSSTKSFTQDENTFSIYDFGQLTQQQQVASVQDVANSNEWAIQNIVVSQRCFIEAAVAEATVPVH